LQNSRHFHGNFAVENKRLFLCKTQAQNTAMIYGYARVSTDGQSAAAHVAALRKHGAGKVFREVASGAKTGEGRERAKRRGVRFGRKPTAHPAATQRSTRRLAEGEETRAELARRYNLHPSTISRLAAET
jgi:DNA invertase Pin-like site-specific DNA recombinase